MTGNVIVNSHFYQVEREKKVYTVFQLVKVSNQKILTDLIRIENFRHFSKGRGFEKYLRLRNTQNWNKCEMVTGLFITDNPELFYGDRLYGGKRNLIVFHFTENGRLLTIDYYNGYYPKEEDLIELLNGYK